MTGSPFTPWQWFILLAIYPFVRIWDGIKGTFMKKEDKQSDKDCKERR
jgi:hypothetical protein